MGRLAGLFLLSSGLLAQSPAAFRIEATHVTVPVTVFDENGRTLSHLRREQFRLLDEGEPRPIRNFIRDQAPLRVVLLLDVSGSLETELGEIRAAAVQFARKLEPEDRLAVIGFADRPRLVQDWTHNWRTLHRSLEDLKSGYRTALYDSLLQTAAEKLASQRERKVILLVTDGLDNQSLSRFEDVIHPLIRAHITLYIVSRTRLVQPQVQRSRRVEFLNQVMQKVLREDRDFVDIYFRQKESSLSGLAESTGGRALFPDRLDQLRGSYLQIVRELKHRYILTFTPPARSDRSFRTIQVRCTAPVGRLLHRTQYHWDRSLSRQP